MISNSSVRMLSRSLHRFERFASFLLLITLFAAPWSCFAQAVSGDLIGTITDQSGAVVPNADVVAVNNSTNVNYPGRSNNQGEYRISNLPPGAYDVSASAPGLAKQILRGVSIQLNLQATANITMSAGTVSTSIQVEAAAPLLDTTTSQIQSTFQSKEAADLPNVSTGQGVLNLSLLGAGVASGGGLGVGTGPSVGGQRPRNNNFMIEGVDNNNLSVTGPQVFIPNDSVAEFTLLQNQFQAEFGHSSGGQFNTIVKSGTNQFHGTVYDYLRNRDLNALDQAFARQGILSNPRYDQNRLGANVGGPILKDKLFFFGSFEYNPLGQTTTPSTKLFAPTAAAYTALAANPAVNQTNLSVAERYAVAPAVSAGAPTISIGGITVPTGILPVAGANYTNNYYGIGTVDYNISNTDQLRGRFVYNKQEATNTGASLPTFYTQVPTTNYLTTISEYHTFSPSVTNELRLGYHRNNSNSPAGNFTFPGLDQFPNLVFNDLNLQLGPNSNFPQSGVSNVYSANENLTWTIGQHTIKVGTEFRKYIAPTSFTQRSRGDYEYTSFARYLTDQVPDYLGQRGVGNVTFYGDQIATYDYAQDTWRIRPNLTLNLGLRYEYTTVPYSERLQSLNSLASVPGLITFNSPQPDAHAFAPRIGLAYSPGASGKTSIRAGFGLAYDVLFSNIGTVSTPPQLSSTIDYTNGNNPALSAYNALHFLATGGIPPNAGGSGTLTAAQARAVTSAYLPDQKLPYSINYTLSIQHVFANNYTLEARYVGTRGVHLVFQSQLNKYTNITPTQNIPTYLSAPSAATLASLPYTVGTLRSLGSTLPAYAAAGFTNIVTSYQPEGSSTYNALDLQLTRRFNNGLQFLGAYTWSHNLDNSTSEFATTYLTPRRAQDSQNLTPEWGNSAIDHRQRFTFSAVYDAPWYKSSANWFLKNLAGNWEMSPVYTYETGEYYTPQSGIDSNLNQDSAPDRAIVNTGGVAGTGSGVYGLTATGAVVPVNATTAQINTVKAWVATNPNARYIQAGYGAYANSGRNIQVTRPIDNIDLSLMKRFTIRERYNLQIMGEALNLFNHAQFIPGSIDNVASVGTATTSALQFVNVSNVNFNSPTQSFSSNPRVLEVVAKFNW